MTPDLHAALRRGLRRLTKRRAAWHGDAGRGWLLPGAAFSTPRPRARRLTTEPLEPRVVLSGDTLLITELMAINSTTLPDGDGNFSDWLEIYNPADDAVDLHGKYLTDDPGNLDKWPLPDRSLDAKDYLVVFASGQSRDDYVDAAGNPHTDFKLSGDGEFLALVDDDEATIIHQYAPQYPVQVADVSYGLTNQSIRTDWVSAGSELAWQVPLSGSGGTDWTQVDFDDATWDRSPSGVGYDTGAGEAADYPTAVLTEAPIAYWRFEETSGLTAENLGTLGIAADATFVGGTSLGKAGPRPPAYEGFAADNRAVGFDGNNDAVTTGVSALNSLGQFTLAGWIRPGSITSSRVGLWGQNDAVEFGFINPGTLEIWTPGGGSAHASYSYPSGQWHHVAAVGDGTRLRIYVDGLLAGTGGSSTGNYGQSSGSLNVGGGGVFDASGNTFTGDIDEVAIFDTALSADAIAQLVAASTLSGGGAQVDFTAEIGTDIEAAMYGANSGVYLRAEFDAENRDAIDQLLLRMKYDDGFVAYLNGQEVARRNAPSMVSWDSAAPTARADSQAVEFETIDITDAKDLLQAGTNVLAIQALNRAADNPDLLLVPELEALVTTFQTDSPRYFTLPTPGAPNGTGDADLGPIVVAVDGPTGQPSDTDTIVVTAVVAEAFAAVADVDLVYRVMYGGETSVAMADDGSGADAMAGDGIYTAQIPASASAPGNLVRWYVTAADADGRDSRAPLFTDQIGRKQSAEYFGTVIADASVDTDLPYLMWFLEPGTEAAAQTRTGTRASLFYLDQLYDNIFVRQRGGSTQSAPKKSFKFEFNPGDHFRFDPAQRRVEEFNLNTTYTDKAYIRQNLAFETYSYVGNPSSISFPMRVDRNGQFYSVSTFIEQVDADLLQREGLDPGGALYKMFNQFTSGTSGVEKKTRKDEDNSDLVSFVSQVNNLSGQALTNYLFDNVNIPAVLDYLVGTVLTHQNDNPHKNYYLYRDSDGTGEWLFLPWDHDLTFGKNWVGTSFSDEMYADNDSVAGKPSDIRPSHPLINTRDYREWNDHWNRLMDALIEDDTIREMYLRRLRSGMDAVFGDANLTGSDRWYDQRVLELFHQVADPTQGGVSDATRDYQKWADPWTWGSDQAVEAAVSVMLGYQIDATGQIVTQGSQPVEVANGYGNRRRTHLYENHAVDDLGNPVAPGAVDHLGRPIDSAGIPPEQIATPPIEFGAIEFNPAGGNQDQEYIELLNPNPYAVDISGWQLHGGVEMTFAPGTVIVAGGNIYATPDVNAFRSRSSGPSGDQGLLVQGDYSGHLSNLGETIELQTDLGTNIATVTYEGAPTDIQQYLRISELHYHPYTALPQFGDLDVDADAFEFIELLNTSDTTTLDLTGVAFTRGISYTFGAIDLAPGARVLVVKDRPAFESRYGVGLNLAGQYGPTSLANDGEPIKIDDANGSTVAQFTYNDRDPWPGRADGKGGSLEVLDTEADYDDPENWRSSSEFGGSPGEAGSGPTWDLLVNEVLSRSDDQDPDQIELVNVADHAVDLSGWYLSDKSDDLLKSAFPNGTTLGSGDYLVLDQTEFGFGLDGNLGGDLWLLEADSASGRPLRFADHVEFDAAATGVTFGRWNDADPAGTLFPMTDPTLGGPNSGPVPGDVILSEIHYQPADPPPGSLIDSDSLQFVEVYNRSGAGVTLAGWRIDGFGFTFPAGTTLAPANSLVVVTFDPVADQATATAFRTAFAIDPSVPLIGPAGGGLRDAGETIKLLRPDDPQDPLTGYLVVDQVTYDNQAPWPTAAAGGGAALERASATAFGSFVSSWQAATPTPGTVTLLVLPGDVNGDGVVNGLDVDPFVDLLLGGSYLAAADLNGDGLVNGLDVGLFVAAVLGQ